MQNFSQASLAAVKAQWPEYSREEHELKEEIEALRGQVTAKVETVTGLRDEVQKWRIKDEMLRAEEDALVEEMSDMKHAADTWDEREKQMRADITALNKDIEAQAEKEEQLTEEISTLTGKDSS